VCAHRGVAASSRSLRVEPWVPLVSRDLIIGEEIVAQARIDRISAVLFGLAGLLIALR